MRTRIAIVGFLAFILIAGTAYAAGKSVSVYVNGKQVQSGTVIDGQTMLPLRSIAEALGSSVEWDGKTHSAKITKPQEAVQAVTEGLSLAQLNKIGESVGVVYAMNGTTYTSQGSGFIVNNNILVTNWHVVDDATSLRIDFGSKSVTVDMKEALFKNEAADLFGIRVEGFPSLKLETSEPKNKDKVYALGFPGNRFTITEGIFVSKWNDDRWTHSAETRGGASGGPVINGKGHVIGVTASTNDAASINQAVRSTILQMELDKIN